MAGAPDAIVVGAGPNGLSAAVALAQAGRRVTVYEALDRIGGGAVSGELTLPGFTHDLCSAVHPTAAVGGTPREIAVPMIAALEGMDRGRYTGPVGWVDAAGDGELGIALGSPGTRRAA